MEISCMSVGDIWNWMHPNLSSDVSIYILKFVVEMFDRPSATTEQRPSTSAMSVYYLLLHHISVTSDTAVHVGRSAVLAVVITHGRWVRRYSGNISHKVVIALWLFTRRLAHTPLSTAAVPLAAQPTLDTAKVPMSLSLTSCTVEQRRRERGVASTWF